MVRPVPALIRFSNGSGNPEQRDGAAGRARDGGEVHPARRLHHRRLDADRPAVRLQHTGRLHRSAQGDAARPDDTAAHGQTPASPIRSCSARCRILREAKPDPGQLRHHRIPRLARLPLDRRRRQRQIRSLPPGSDRIRGVPVGVRCPRQGSRLSHRRAEARVWTASPCGSTSGCRSPGPPTRRWTRQRPGRARRSSPWAPLAVTGLDTEREHGGDIVVFDPMRVTDGHRTLRRSGPALSDAGVFGVGQAAHRRRARRRRSASRR